LSVFIDGMAVNAGSVEKERLTTEIMTGVGIARNAGVAAGSAI
jgi:hypothetical protein